MLDGDLYNVQFTRLRKVTLDSASPHPISPSSSHVYWTDHQPIFDYSFWPINALQNAKMYALVYGRLVAYTEIVICYHGELWGLRYST